MSHYADKETQWALINATNLICDHIIKKLPAGWNLTLEIQDGEASASLFMPDGNELTLDGTDYGISSIDDMCVRAIETEAENKEQQS
jgi:hypothetical protein